MPKTDLLSLPLEELTGLIQSLGQKPYRAKQVYGWLFRKLATGFEEMSDLPKDFRALLADSARISQMVPAKKTVSADGTRKYLFTLEDGQAIESVLIPDEDRLTVCISSQVGCAMGCAFCLTGKLGFTRNLTPGEITGQVLAVERDLRNDPYIDPQTGTPVEMKENGPVHRYLTHIVVMGMGEPMMNLENLLISLKILIRPDGMNWGPGRITVSTVGVVPKMEEFLSAETGVRLAISLTSADDSKRDQLLPINKVYPLAQLIQTLKKYPVAERRPLTFEYVMLKGVNDSQTDALQLVRLLQGLHAKVNLIPLNASPDVPFERPSQETMVAFQKALWKAGLTATLRESRGRDILAACGQLKAQK
jgi:23S rRNA (adenine2503-C2)-methyltransferase